MTDAQAKLRRVSYVRHEFHGRPSKREDSLLVFVYDIPYFGACGVFPPLHLLNELLLSGGGDGGMGPGTSWQPFSLSEQEYQDLVTAVRTVAPEKLRRRARYAELPYKVDPSFDHYRVYSDWRREVCAKHRGDGVERDEVEGWSARAERRDSFDLYFAKSGIEAGSLAVGQRVWLDGIDGFFDQYFDAPHPGDLIRYLNFPYGPGAIGVAAVQVAELPLVSARIIEADSLGGTMEVLEVTPFASWLRHLPAQAMVAAAELREGTQAPIENLLAEVKRSGSALWTSGATRIRSHNHLTAVYALAAGERVRVAVLRTNGVPGTVVDVIPDAGA